MLNKLKSKQADKYTKEEIYLIIREFINSEKDLVIRKAASEESFDSPAWSEKQAYSLGIIKMCDKVLNFIPDKGPIKNV